MIKMYEPCDPQKQASSLSRTYFNDTGKQAVSEGPYCSETHKRAFQVMVLVFTILLLDGFFLHNPCAMLYICVRTHAHTRTPT